MPKIEDKVQIYGVSTANRLLTLSKDPEVSDTAQHASWETSKRRAEDRRSPEEFLNAPLEEGEGHKGDIKSRYECNISYGNNVPTILHQFLKLGTPSEACFAGPMGCPSIALPLGAAHPFGGYTIFINIRPLRFTFFSHPSPLPLLTVESSFRLL